MPSSTGLNYKSNTMTYRLIPRAGNLVHFVLPSLEEDCRAVILK
jgi:hypothetical protein